MCVCVWGGGFLFHEMFTVPKDGLAGASVEFVYQGVCLCIYCSCFGVLALIQGHCPAWAHCVRGGHLGAMRAKAASGHSSRALVST